MRIYRSVAILRVAAIVDAMFVFILIAIGLTSHLVALGPHGSLNLTFVITFQASGVLLLVLGKTDVRAQCLGICFMLTGLSFSERFLEDLAGTRSIAALASELVLAARLHAFIPLVTWIFASDFPSRVEFGRVDTLLRICRRSSAVVGALLVLTGIAAFAASRFVLPIPAPVTIISQYHWLFVLALALPSLPAIWWRTQTASVAERRRGSLLAGGLLFGTGPSILWNLLAAGAPATVARIAPIEVAGWVLYPTLLSTPFLVAYAILVRQALEIKLVVRAAVRYVMARYTLLGIVATPAILLIVSIYRNRDGTISELVSSREHLGLMALSVLGMATVRGREGLLNRVDAHFFREQYDARILLSELVERCLSSSTASDLAERICTGVDSALHPETVRILLLDPQELILSSPVGEARSLAVSSALVQEWVSSPGPVNLDPMFWTSTAHRLSEDDRHWLVDQGFRLMLPLKAADRSLLGVLVLGEKKSELPFSREDEVLLAAVASAAVVSLEHLATQPKHQGQSAFVNATLSEGESVECESCGNVMPAPAPACIVCSGPTMVCLLPRVVSGKFKVESRIGSGGMGVVYKGTDLELFRPVALKTLPFVSPDEAAQLRREARAVAAVSHPNLALIYGAETCRGRPILVFEFLSGRTLAHRLESGPLPLAEALGLVGTLASVLQTVHGRGVLHRDIKPSNIGFTEDGIPKLLDFGLARIIDQTVAPETQSASAPLRFLNALDLSTIDSSTHASLLRGTPLYMSPEALQGARPDESFDLWSVCVVGYEALTGLHPFAGDSWPTVRTRILNGSTADVRDYAPSIPVDVAHFFKRALSAQRSDRPRSPAALRDAIESLRSSLSA